jgi:hypothetical protein
MTPELNNRECRLNRQKKTPAEAGVFCSQAKRNYMAATKSGTIMGLFS